MGLSVSLFIFGQLKSLLSCRRGVTETHNAFKAWFAAQMSKCNSMDTISNLRECTVAQCLLFAADADDSQRIAIMAAASTNDDSNTPRSVTGSFLKAATYASVSSVLRQCDHSTTSALASIKCTGTILPLHDQMDVLDNTEVPAASCCFAGSSATH